MGGEKLTDDAFGWKPSFRLLNVFLTSLEHPFPSNNGGEDRTNGDPHIDGFSLTAKFCEITSKVGDNSAYPLNGCVHVTSLFQISVAPVTR